MNTCQSPTPSAVSNTANPTVLRPQVLTREDESGLSLQVALPGVRKEALKLTLHQSNLTLEADRNEALPENWKTHRDTHHSGRYRLNVRLAARLDGARTSASFENGVLTLCVPIREEAKPRQIEVA